MATHLFSVRRALTGIVLSVALNLASGCHKDATLVTAVATPGTPHETLAKLGGDAQAGFVALPLQSPFIARVTLDDGTGVAGVAVTWTVATGGGSLSTSTSTTDDQGYAEALLTLGTVVGANSVTATPPDGQSVSFSANGIPGSVAALVKLQGDQQVMADGSLSAPFVVKAVDLYGNPVAGVTVAWNADNGTPVAPTAVTDANGLAQDVLQAAATDATYDVTADVAGLAPVTFTATSVASTSGNVRLGARGD
ncbi:MAG: Ig-like domain-containing protein [Gemmatimonadetes bacterium]|nr:Ig-like domain-containing protein [Gemmatimonadota bacterium]